MAPRGAQALVPPFQARGPRGSGLHHLLPGLRQAGLHASSPTLGARWNPGEYAGVAFVRSLHIWNVPFIVDYDNPAAVITVPFPPFVIIIPSVYPDFENVRPIFIPPYEIFYAGPRYYYDWVSVPESYPVPRVKGTPLSLPFSR
jgi:hypothetical protein